MNWTVKGTHLWRARQRLAMSAEELLATHASRVRDARAQSLSEPPPPPPEADDSPMLTPLERMKLMAGWRG